MSSKMSRQTEVQHRPVARSGLLENDPPNGVVTAVKTEKKDSCSTSLHKIEDVPNYLRYNPYIKCGYRQQLNVKQCCSSLFYLHNETVNIYTHAFAGLLCLFWIPFSTPPSIHVNPVLYIFHYIGCLSPFIGSTIYHLFMCHRSGTMTYDCLLKFDMCGVWAMNAFGGITAIKATLFCSTSIVNTCVALYVTMALILLYFILTAKNAKQRFFPLLPFGIVRYVFLAIRGVRLWQQQPSGASGAVIYYILMDQAALFGGIINVARFPECYFQDKLDFCFNSHNLMHVIVSLCPVLLQWGTVLDFNWMALYQCN